MKAHQHTGYVQTGPDFFFAVCAACGWQGLVNRATQEEAQRDLNDHIATTGIEINLEEA